MTNHIPSRYLTSKKLVESYDKAIKLYNDYIQKDRIDAVTAGATELPSKGFIDKANEQAAVQGILGIKYDLLDFLNEQKEAVKDKLTEPPSTKAAAYIAAISGRSDLTIEEVEAALDRYTDHATQHAVYAAAKRSGMNHYYGKTDAEIYSEDLDYMAAQVENVFSPFSFSASAGDKARQAFERVGLASISEPHRDAWDAFKSLLGGGDDTPPEAAAAVPAR